MLRILRDWIRDERLKRRAWPHVYRDYIRAWEEEHTWRGRTRKAIRTIVGRQGP